MLLALAPFALSACGLGSDDASGSDDLDDRTATMACLQDAGIAARLEGPEGKQEIVVGDGANPPHIKFLLTAALAEAEQFQGRGEGAEQIGAALLYVGDGSDDLLQGVEKCLANL
ncbi:MAG: hypothetical protein QOK00_1058 [Thermoleophilaceae bacterium]|nr:hypothetical protein [Thermoleophilaceae bacterium]MEA2400655.1 hypothetical protein [Thermoleophilaceae bacterium]